MIAFGLIGCVIWTRVYLPQRYLIVSLGLLVLAGVVLQFGGITVRGIVVAPALLLVSVLPMLWFLYEAWDTGFVTWWSAGPLLPYSDAAGYLSGAKSLVEIGSLGDFSAFRPLGACLQALFLFLTNQNYQTTLVCLTLLAGVATFFVALEMWRASGPAASAIYLFLAYAAVFEFLPTFMTEIPGYIFASLAAAFLLAGFRARSLVRAVFGLALLALGLSMRAGAMFVLPALGVYVVLFFSRSVKESFRPALAVVGVVAISLSLGQLILLRAGPPNGQYQGPLAYTLYGIASGGKGWDYVFQEHPELWEFATNGERAHRAYELFWERFQAQPGIFFYTLCDSFLFALKNAAPVFFGLVKFIPPIIPALLALLALALLMPAAWKRQGAWSFLPAAALGIVLSSPFLFDSGFRVYMATLPIHLLLVAFAVPLVFQRLRKRASTSENDSEMEFALPNARVWDATRLWFSVSLITALVAFPMFLSFSQGHKIAKARGLIRSPNEAILFFNPASGLLLEEKSRDPRILSSSFQGILKSPYFAPELNLEKHIVSGDFLCHALLLPNPTDKAYVIFDRVPSDKAGYLRVTLRQLENNKGAWLYKAEKVEPVTL